MCEEIQKRKKQRRRKTSSFVYEFLEEIKEQFVQSSGEGLAIVAIY